ncbi:Na/Pi cotransporter family protein [Marivita sp. GX14005]|uniref:Na/Pi cotransporter family protein n=1 Tax=Marivita sp. GX14005 TaxID=2942276 RepID=UPI002019F45E|nr:Na/Pi cotransporter family protein [Marivita sp. GX14005]MCL3881570.1 Na/Pi cotransporter family protein [Marivita sp. GX14005]
MQILYFLVQLSGAVLLLLFAVRMVRTGIERATGPRLHRAVGKTRSPLPMMASGLLMAMVLQSSAAVALLVAGFAASGGIGFAPGLAMVLGGDLGSAILIMLFSFHLEALVPLLLTLGGLIFLRANTSRWKQAGRILVGIALILIALRYLREAVEPIRDSAVLPALAAYLERDFVTAFLAGAALAFIMHSSVATILMTVAVVGLGAIPLAAGISIVLGANLGSTVIPVWLTRHSEPAARRIPLANLMLRGSAAFICATAIDALGLPTLPYTLGESGTLVALHIAFNFGVLVLIVLATPLEALLRKAIPDAPLDHEAKPLHKSHLDPGTTDVPVRALASLRREVIRMADVLSEMLAPLMELYQNYDPVRAAAIFDEDAVLNKALDDIRIFVAEMPQHAMPKDQKRELRALVDYAIALEAAGDLLVKRLLDLAKEKSDRALEFSDEGYAELTVLHSRLSQNLATASSVLVSNDLIGARQLIEEKAEMARLERKTRKAHLKRLSAGNDRSFSSSDIHIETAYTLKEMHSWVVTVAHPILVREGQLLESRLADGAKA